MKAYILLDRSGSMSSRWTETINALNAYVEGLRDKDSVLIAAFDGQIGLAYDVVRDSKVSEFTPISQMEIQPRGMTPLVDAANTILNKAFEEDKKKVIMVFITDGDENSSREVTIDVVREKLAKAEERNWEVLFIGADFEGVGKQAASFGVGASKFLNVASGNLNAELTRMANDATLYAAKGTRINYTDADRTRAATKITDKA